MSKRSSNSGRGELRFFLFISLIKDDTMLTNTKLKRGDQITIKEYIHKLSKLNQDRQVVIIGVSHDGSYSNEIEEIDLDGGKYNF